MNTRDPSITLPQEPEQGPEAAPPSRRPALQQIGSMLLRNSSAQVGSMVMSVILVGQAIAKFSESASLYVAFLFLCLWLFIR